MDRGTRRLQRAGDISPPRSAMEVDGPEENDDSRYWLRTDRGQGQQGPLNRTPRASSLCLPNWADVARLVQRAWATPKKGVRGSAVISTDVMPSVCAAASGDA